MVRARTPRSRSAVLVAALGAAVAAAFVPGCARRATGPSTTPPAPTRADRQRTQQEAIRAHFARATRFAPFLAPTGEPLADFDVARPPPIDAPTRTCLQSSPVAFRVDLANGTASIHPTAALAVRRDPLPPAAAGDERLTWPAGTTRRVVPLEHGDLVALSAPDRAGEIWFVAPGGPPRMVLAGTLVDVVVTPAGPVAAVGQGYVTSEHGALYLLAPAEGGLEPRRLADLGEVPRALFAESDGTVLVATPRALLRLDPAARDPFPRLVHRGQWLALRPTSVVREEDGTVYLGIRHAVVRLVPTESGYREDWLLPRTCPEEAGEACACLARAGTGADEAIARASPSEPPGGRAGISP